MNLNISNINNFLDKIRITSDDVEGQIKGFILYCPKYRNDIVEKKEKFPIFVTSFYKLIGQINRIPNQEEFFNFYMNENANNDTIIKYKNDDDVIWGLECRIRRLYPSLVRDIHLALFLKKHIRNNNCYIFYDIEMDLNNDIDVGIILNRNSIYALNLYIKTERSENFRNNKTRRHTHFDNVKYLEYPKKRITDNMIGMFYLYGMTELRDINSKLKELK